LAPARNDEETDLLRVVPDSAPCSSAKRKPQTTLKSFVRCAVFSRAGSIGSAGYDDVTEADMTKCDECNAAVQICERCDGVGKKRWSGECSYCRGTGQLCMRNPLHRW
jgi:hypothetical protein